MSSEYPDYTLHDPKGWCGDPKRGAAMGRGSYHVEDKEAFEGKMFVKYVRLSGDYDSNGTYFGGGPGTLPLYWCTNEDQTIDFMLRATDREDAKEQVKRAYPKARFFR